MRSQAAPPEEPCADQMARLSKVVDLLEQLAHAGLPTLINAFYRSGDFTKHHFHGDPSTASFPRVGNLELSAYRIPPVSTTTRSLPGRIQLRLLHGGVHGVQCQEASTPIVVPTISASCDPDCGDDRHVHPGHVRCAHQGELQPGGIHPCLPDP